MCDLVFPTGRQTNEYFCVCVYSEVSSGGRYTLSSGRPEVSLTLDSSVRGDSGDWTCSAQVFESNATAGPMMVGESVNRTIELVVVGE